MRLSLGLGAGLALALVLQGCSPQLKSCEGVDAGKCLSVLGVCSDERSQTFACRVSLLNEYCKLSEEKLPCASRILKVTVAPDCRSDKDASAPCLLAVKQVIDQLVLNCAGPGLMPQACAWLGGASMDAAPRPRQTTTSTAFTAPAPTTVPVFEDFATTPADMTEDGDPLTAPFDSTTPSAVLRDSRTEIPAIPEDGEAGVIDRDQIPL